MDTFHKTGNLPTREPHIHTPAHDPARHEDMAWAQAEAAKVDGNAPSRPYAEFRARARTFQSPGALCKDSAATVQSDMGTAAWWRERLPRKPDWWDRLFAAPFEEKRDADA